jgi:hypothetical protein
MPKRQSLLTGVACALLLVSAAISAQYGTAPSGYYPASFNGSTFKGAVAAISNDEVTLSFSKGADSETFTAHFETGCSIPGEAGKPARIMMPANIPVGSGLTAFYMTRTEKADGKKAKENWIVAISIDAWGKRKIPEDRQGIMYCTDSKLLNFQAFR